MQKVIIIKGIGKGKEGYVELSDDRMYYLFFDAEGKIQYPNVVGYSQLQKE